jgi:tRNA(Ile)-lysidine synthase
MADNHLSDFAKAVHAALRDYDMAPPGSTILVAVSGGPDSSALLTALAELRSDLQLHLHAGHIHHGLRGADAEEDLHAAQSLAERLGVPFSAGRAEVAVSMAEHRISEEVAGRRARYAYLCSLARAIGAGRIATGHNADDQVETILMRIIRGTGLEGLSGIPPVGVAPDPAQGSPVSVIRPLIRISRAGVLDYCRSLGLQLRTDPSNLDPGYLRNRVRLELLPLLRNCYNSDLAAALINLAELAREDNSFLEARSRDAWHAACEEECAQAVIFRLAKLPEHKALLRRVIRRAILRLNPDHVPHFRAVERVVEAVKTGQAPRFDLEGGIYAEVKKGVLRLASQKVI